MHDIWNKKQRVTYSDFSEFVKENHPLDTTLHIPKHTFSRFLHEFLQDNCIMKYNNSELHTIIKESILNAIQGGIVSSPKIWVIPAVTKCISTKIPINYLIPFVPKKTTYPFTNHHPCNQTPELFFRSVPQEKTF
jgi:hypothetical protein